MATKPDWPLDFVDQFWCAYPRRVAKKAAVRALEIVRRSGEVDFGKLLDAVKLYAWSVREKDMQYVAHPATWLNQGRWDDEPAAITDTRKGSVAGAFDELIARRDAQESPDGFVEWDSGPLLRH